MPSLSPLIPDKRRDRFLEELAQHREDSPDPASLGDEAIITQAFNTYAMERRTRNRVIIAIVTLTAFVFPLLAIITSANNIDTIDVWWEALIIVPAFLLLIPVVPFTLLITPFLSQALETAQLIVLMPTVTALTWMLISYLLLNPPKLLTRYFEKE